MKIVLPPALDALIRRLRRPSGIAVVRRDTAALTDEDSVDAVLPDEDTDRGDLVIDKALPSSEEEEALVDAMILQGWEQGCWLNDSVAAYSLDARQQRAVFVATAQRLPIHREQYLADQGFTIPETLPQDGDEPDDVIWVVVTQRCDMIKGLRQEPAITLVRATKCAAREAKEKTRRSPYLYTIRAQGESAWVADFREIITIAKAILKGYQPRQCLRDGIKPRRRFALAYAQRTWRRPVPTDIQRKVQAPLINMRKLWRNEFYKYISDILVDIEELTGKLIIYAVIGDDDDEDSGGESLDELETRLARFFDGTVLEYLSAQSGDIFNERDSAVIPAEQLTMATVFKTYKLDLDFLSADEGDVFSQL